MFPLWLWADCCFKITAALYMWLLIPPLLSDTSQTSTASNGSVDSRYHEPSYHRLGSQSQELGIVVCQTLSAFNYFLLSHEMLMLCMNKLTEIVSDLIKDLKLLIWFWLLVDVHIQCLTLNGNPLIKMDKDAIDQERH